MTPVHDVSVRPYISGFVDEIRVKGGSEVKAGDVMVIIDQAEYKARLDAAKAAVAQAEASFNNSSVYYQRMQKAGARAVSKPNWTTPRLRSCRRRPLWNRPKPLWRRRR